jgi:DNA-binding CsgD family transcriptional regulator
VLWGLSRNLSYPQIARRLHISVETARTHGDAVRRKLSVSSKRDLIGMPVPNPEL